MSYKKENSAIEILTFSKENSTIRSLNINDEFWFVAMDVCAAIGITDVSQALQPNEKKNTKGLDDDEKLMRRIYVSGQKRSVWLINESGLYNLIFQSAKPEAKSFRKWVTNEVLPQLRKTGSYDMTVQVPERLKEVKLNNRVLYPYRKFCYAVGYKSVNYSRIKIYPNHFVKLMGLQHVSKELALLILQNRKSVAKSEQLKEMQPVLPANFGQLMIGGLI